MKRKLVNLSLAFTITGICGMLYLAHRMELFKNDQDSYDLFDSTKKAN